MDTNPRKNIVVVVGLVLVIIFTSGCLPSKFEKEIEKTEKENEKTKQETPMLDQEDAAPEDVKLSPEQIKNLEGVKETTPEEAILENNLENRMEVKIKVPVERSSYTDVNEFSHFVSHLFYMYHTKQVKPDIFHKKLSPHFHESFKELLPDSATDQIRTFEVLQEQFLIRLPSPINNYKITNIETNPRTSESNFYRMYELENKEKVFYMTVIKKSKDGQWLLVDDKPAPPYEIQKAQEKFINTEEDSTN